MKRSCTSQWPCQRMISIVVWAATQLAEVLVGQEDHARRRRSDSTTSTAFAEVQQMSDSAFTAAEVLT